MINTGLKNNKKGLVVDKMDIMGHEQVVFCADKETGLKAIIAIHDTTLGPALGGTRMWNYENEEKQLFHFLCFPFSFKLIYQQILRSFYISNM